MASPLLRQHSQRKVLQLFFRATHVQGSSSIVTRSSLLSWAQVHMCMDGANVAELHCPLVGKLIQRCIATCDEDRIDVWSDGGVLKMLEVVTRA